MSKFSNPHKKDIVMVVKQRMHSAEWSQPPFVFIPARTLESIADKWPQATVARKMMHIDDINQLTKTMAKISAEPWNLFEGAKYIDSLVKQSGKVPPPRAAPWLNIMQYRLDSTAMKMGQVHPDRLDPAMFEPSTVGKVEVKSTACKGMAKKKTQKEKKASDQEDGEEASPDLPAEPVLPPPEPADMMEDGSSPSLPPDVSEAESAATPSLKRPASNGMKRPAAAPKKRPAAAMAADGSGQAEAVVAAAKPKAKGRPKEKAKARRGVDHEPSQNEAIYFLKNNMYVVIPEGVTLGCTKCRSSHVGCRNCRLSKGFVLEGNIWRHHQPSAAGAGSG